MTARLESCLGVLTLILAAGAGAVHRAGGPGADGMAGAARKYLDSLSPELRARANPTFEDAARSAWSFVPQSRPGVTLGEMNDEQRMTARGLLRTVLSTGGALKAETIMTLDGILREIEKGQPIAAMRDPLAYTVTVYGDPRPKGLWGWKLEGHHISLNFTASESGDVSVTPAFLGANPAEVRQGPRAGLRVLAIEEDVGRELAKSLDEAQQKEAVTAAAAPADILAAPGRSLDAAPSAGLAYSKMKSEQRKLIERLLDEYAGNLRQELAAAELDRIHGAGMDQVRFAWMGGMEPGQGHYYRISGPTFVIEYDNTQNGANHVHTIWHDRERDFGRDALKDHYRQDPAPK